MAGSDSRCWLAGGCRPSEPWMQAVLSSTDTACGPLAC